MSLRCISEELITQFHFVADGSIHVGMITGKELYTLYASFKCGNQLKAYQTACELIKDGDSRIILTVTPSFLYYKLWLSIRATTPPRTQLIPGTICSGIV